MGFADERHAKLRRIYGGSSVAHRQIVQLVANLRDEIDQEDAMNITEKQLERAIDNLWDKFGIVEHLDVEGGGDPFEWTCLSLPKLLQHIVAESPAWARELRLAWQSKSCSKTSPYHLLVYGDEIVPGNVLRLDNKRKFFAVYVSIQEMRPSALKHEGMWLPVAVMRTTVAKTIASGISACMRRLYDRWLIDDDLSGSGVLIDLGLPDSRYVNLYFVAGVFVADADAHRAVFNAKGSAGKLPCFMCKNVVSDPEAASISNYLVSLSCTDVRCFDRCTNRDLWDKADMLVREKGRLGVGAFKQLTVAIGINYEPEGILFDIPLRRFLKPCDIVCYDSMHCVLSNGLAQNEVALLLCELDRHHVTWSHLRLFADSNWQVDRTSALNSNPIKECFSTARERALKDSGHFKATASEMLLLMPILLFFLDTIVAVKSICEDQVASFRALYQFQACIRLAKDGQCRPAEVERTCSTHAVAFKKAYGEDFFKPKNHFATHLGPQTARHGVIYDTFVGERKHQQLKRAAQDITRHSRFERTTLLRALSRQLAIVSKPDYLVDRLLCPKSSPDLAAALGFDTAALSVRMVWRGTTLHAGQCMVFDGVVHMVKACVLLGGELHLAMAVYDFVAKAGIVKPLCLGRRSGLSWRHKALCDEYASATLVQWSAFPSAGGLGCFSLAP